MDESIYIIGVVASIVSAFIVMAIFHSKGRSAGGGFALGFFLGVIGIIIALFVSSDQEKLNQRKFDHGELAQCPHCKEFIKLNATMCKHCHQPLPPDAVIRQPYKPRSDAPKKTILAFVGFFITTAASYIFQPIILYGDYGYDGGSFIWLVIGLLAGSIRFAVAVTLAELPSFHLEQMFRGFAAGLLFVLLPTFLSSALSMLDVYYGGGIVIITVIVSVVSGVLAALIIDLPRFRWGRVLLFAVAGLGVMGFEIGAFWQVIFLSLGYGLVPRDFNVRPSKPRR